MAFDVKLPEEVALEREVEGIKSSRANRLTGKFVFAVARSKVYSPDATRQEMNDSHRIGVPLLEPLKISSAKWDRDSGCVLAKLEIPNGFGLALIPLEDRQQCDGGEFVMDVPRYLTAAEKTAIKRQQPVRGMSEVALWYAIGYPEKENDYGRAGKQLVYPGNILIYVNTQGVVEDIQRMSR